MLPALPLAAAVWAAAMTAGSQCSAPFPGHSCTLPLQLGRLLQITIPLLDQLLHEALTSQDIANEGNTLCMHKVDPAKTGSGCSSRVGSTIVISKIFQDLYLLLMTGYLVGGVP